MYYTLPFLDAEKNVLNPQGFQLYSIIDYLKVWFCWTKVNFVSQLVPLFGIVQKFPF